ncbi:MAG: carbonic anhydrase [Candidatus Eremiobacteraeota bacterium]|nr:carbonic anhydrase [Candidatus Eremiobacteraeota bacterium]
MAAAYVAASLLHRSNADAAKLSGAGVSSAQALSRLRAGNARFVDGKLTHQNGVVERRLALTGHQAPFASILSCSDSRVPPELLFDASVGDLFVVRNAGNFVGPPVLGTLEYGYDALGVKLIVVLGHEKCGAVSATSEALRDKKPLPPHLDVIEAAIAPGIATIVAARGTLHAAVVANAKAQAARLLSSPILGPAIKNRSCTIIPADYDFTTGKVSFLT